MSISDLGVGLVCLPGLEPIVGSIASDCGVIEVEPQPFWLNDGPSGAPFRLNQEAFDRIQGFDRPLLVHSVGTPVGGTDQGDPRHMAALGETLGRLKPAWWSEHLSFVATGKGAARRNMGFLMPPVQSRESIALIVERIRLMQDAFGLPFAFETGVNYLRPLEGEIPDGAFWGEIATRADCGILLDLHNLWCNGRNGRQAVEAVLGDLPLERVWEIHMASGQAHKGYWLDAHSGLPPTELLALAASVVPRLPNLGAINLEIIPDYLAAADLTAEDLRRCLAALSAIWATRAGAPRAASLKAGPVRESAALPPPGDWEARLGAALAPGDRAAPGPFAGDPALEIYRDLIAMVRRGTIAESLGLSLRYLWLALGDAEIDRLLEGFWRTSGPEPFMADEAAGFAAFVKPLQLLPHLDELLAFELAAHQAELTGRAQQVRFSCDAELLIAALKAGRLPAKLAPAKVEVEVVPTVYTKSR